MVHNWQILVKVLHSWKQTTAFAGNTLEFILADETGVEIAASCKRNQISRLQRELPVGEWKTIDMFAVLGISGQYRPTTHRYKLSFSEETMITKCQVLSDDHYHSLASYDDLRKIDEKKNFFLKDVIGQVVDLDGIQTVQARGKDEQRVQFRCDARFAKITFFRGEVQVSNAFDASIVAINPKLEEAIELKEKILANDLPLALIEKREEKKLTKKQKQDWDEIPVRAISEILEATEVESCKIICSIESIDTDWGWFYFGCNRNRHNRRVTKQVPKLSIAGSVMSNPSQKPLFYCDICRGITPDVSPKYKLHLFVKDDSDSCIVMMLDSVAQSIIGSAATELWDDPTILPQPIESLVGKSFCFGISLSTDNVNNGNTTFKVSEVWSGDKIQKIESQTEPCSLLDTYSSTLSGGEVSLVDPNKESSSEGFSTPFSKRKEADADLLDMTSTSKKPCTQKIKMENTKTEEKKENRATDELSVRSHRGLTDRSVPNRVFNDVKNRTTTPTTPVNNFKRSRENSVFTSKLIPRIPFTPVTSLNLSVGEMGKENCQSSEMAKRHTYSQPKTDTLILSLLANQSCKSGLTTVRHADSIDPRKRSRTVFNDITNISLEQENGTQVINKRPRKVNDNMKRSNPSPGETTDKEEESEEDDNFAIEGSHYVNEDQYFDCTTPENTDSESEVDSETENYDDHNVKKTEAERKQSVLSRMEALLQMAFTGRNSCAKQTS
ncbi:hypothetical protein HID58_013494, partial [Brassica napus]